MKVAIFFDGQNFYRSLLRYDGRLMTPGWIINKIEEA